MARPNILLFMPDQLRGDWVGPRNRAGTRTPALDALMARGVSFSSAICPSPICGPSRACLATGHEYDRTTVRTNKFSLAATTSTFYRQLRDGGYQVLTCGKLDLLKGELDWGRDGQHFVDGRSRLAQLGFTGGLDSAGKHAVIFAHEAGRDEPYLAFLEAHGLADKHVTDFARRANRALGPNAVSHPSSGPNFWNTEPCQLPDDAYQDNWIGRCGLEILEGARASDAPWFLQVNFAGPHEPMNITRSMAARVARLTPPPPSVLGDIAPQKHLAIRRNYIAMIENIDAILADYVTFLERTGQLDNTLVIFTSDHGEMLGDCGLWEKFVPHQPSIHVPLVFAGPGVVAGHVLEHPATFLDLHATILDAAGIDPLAGVDSLSLRATLADPSVRSRDVVFSGLGLWRIAFDGRYKLVAGYDRGTARKAMESGFFNPDDSAGWRLVDVVEDPLEENDLSGELPERAQALAALLRDNACRTVIDSATAGTAVRAR